MATSKRAVRSGVKSADKANKKSGIINLRTLKLASRTLVSGKEEFLITAVLARFKEIAKKKDASTMVHEIEASSYVTSGLDQITSPSLFGEPRLVIVDHLERMNDVFLQEALAQLQGEQDPDVWLVYVHRGGNRGKKLLTALQNMAEQVVCDPIKYDSQKIQFVTQMVKAQKREISAQAAQILVDALGDDLAQLAGAVRQLIADVSEDIGVEAVKIYYGARVEVNGFEVADLTINGKIAPALVALRHAFEVGVTPVAVVAAIIYKIRQITKVLAYKAGQLDISDLGMQPWQLNQVQQEARYWTSLAVGVAYRAVTKASYETKGGSADAEYAVEKAVRAVCRARRLGK